jgi:hypothetical protein
LAENLEPRLSDFGLARLIENNDTHVTVTIGGTYGYIAPGMELCALYLALQAHDAESMTVTLLHSLNMVRILALRE